MDITNQLALFHPNYLASKREQIKLAKLIKLNTDELINPKLNSNKVKPWRVENKKLKKYIPQDSKYNFRQIVKNFKLNREQLLHGYSNKYINILTNLLYENNQKKYAKKRLLLFDFRKKILKKKLNTSFEEYIEKEPLSDRYNFSKQKMKNIYLTTVQQKLDKEKNKSKYSSKKEISEKKEKNKNKNRILLNSNDDKIKLKLNFDNNNNNKSVKIFSYKDRYKKINNENINIINCKNSNLYGQRVCNTSFNESNINQIINDDTYRKDDNDDEYKYSIKLNPKEEFLQRRNKIKYIDYLKNKYNFYTSGNIKDLKNYSEMKKRQILFDSNKEQIEQPLEFPYKKEFFKKFNRYNSRNKIKILIKDIKSSEIPIKYIKQKIKNN